MRTKLNRLTSMHPECSTLLWCMGILLTFGTTAVAAPGGDKIELKSAFSLSIPMPGQASESLGDAPQVQLPGNGMANLRVILPPEPGLCDADVLVRVGSTTYRDHSSQNRRYFSIVQLPDGSPVTVHVTAASQELGADGKPKFAATIRRIVSSNPDEMSVGDYEIRFETTDFIKPDKPDAEVVVVLGASEPSVVPDVPPEKVEPEAAAQENQISFALCPQLTAFVKYEGEGGVMSQFQFARGTGQTDDLLGIEGLSGPHIRLLHTFSYPEDRLPKDIKGNVFFLLRWKGKAAQGGSGPVTREYQIPAPQAVTFVRQAGKSQLAVDIPFAVNSSFRTTIERILSNKDNAHKDVISVLDRPDSLELAAYVQFVNGPAIALSNSIPIALEDARD